MAASPLERSTATPVGPTTQIGEDGEEMSIAVSNIAFCQRCLRAFVSSDAVVSSLTNVGNLVARQYWHDQCWKDHVVEVTRHEPESEPE